MCLSGFNRTEQAGFSSSIDPSLSTPVLVDISGKTNEADSQTAAQTPQETGEKFAKAGRTDSSEQTGSTPRLVESDAVKAARITLEK